MSVRTRMRTGVVIGAAAAALVPVVAAVPASAAFGRTPVPSVTVLPAPLTNQTTVQFVFTDSNAAATFTCSFDRQRSTACKSPMTYTKLTAGTHTLTVRASVAGARSATSTRSVVVDLTPPAAPVVGALPSGPVNAALHPTVTDTSTDVAGYRCSIDGVAATACTSGSAQDAATDGLHHLAVTAVDGAGNVSPATTVTWIRDTHVSVPVVSSGPATVTSDTTAAFTYTSADNDVTYLCSRDGSAFTACPASGQSYSGLSVAGHSFTVRAKDAVGNTADSVPFAWAVVAPSPTRVALSWTSPASLPAPITNIASASFAFQAVNASSVSCALDGAAAATCTTSYVAAGLADGHHQLVVTAAGSGGPVALSYSWQVDTTPPAAPSVYGITPITASTSISSLVVPSQLEDTTSCTLDGVSVPCGANSPVSKTGLLDGQHQLVASESDKVGNSAQTVVSWTVDTTPPTYSVTAPVTTTGATTVSFDENVVPAAASPELTLATGAVVPSSRSCLTAGGAPTDCAAAAVRRVVLRPTAPLVPGQYYVVAVNGVGLAPLTDIAGNPAATGTVGFRAATSVQENDPATTQLWRRVPAAAARGRSFVTESTPGARASWTFTGTGFTAYLASGPSFGIVAVYVDGHLKAGWNTYAAKPGFGVPHALTRLPNRSHTVTFVVTGKKGARAAKGAAVGIDAFVVGRTVVASPVLTTSWARLALRGSAGGAQSLSGTAGTTFSVVFRGRTITWVHATGPAFGVAEVYVDGVRKATIDLYSPKGRPRVAWQLRGLSDAQHSLRIVPTGGKRAASKGTLVSIDTIATS